MLSKWLDKIVESPLAASIVGWMMLLSFLFLVTGITIWSFKWVLSLLFGI